jgi:hypothetical protein
MKKIILMLLLLLPFSLMAHEGHGISGDKILHLLVSHNFAEIFVVIAFVGFLVYRFKARTKK